MNCSAEDKSNIASSWSDMEPILSIFCDLQTHKEAVAALARDFLPKYVDTLTRKPLTKFEAGSGLMGTSAGTLCFE